MCNFEAIVVRPTDTRFSPNGTSVPLKVWLPHTAGELPISSYESLQRDYEDELEIVPDNGRALIIQTVMVCSRDGVRKAARRLAGKVQHHLGIPTTIQ